MVHMPIYAHISSTTVSCCGEHSLQLPPAVKMSAVRPISGTPSTALRTTCSQINCWMLPATAAVDTAGSHQRRAYFNECLLKSGKASTGHGLQVLLPIVIYTAGPISGAHFNPMVTSVFVATRLLVSSIWTCLRLS